MTDPSGLPRNAANHVPLSPIAFLERAADVFPDRVAVIHGALSRTWSETRDRCHRLAAALAARGVARGDTVAILAPNIPAMIEAHFGVPQAGAVLLAINTRLDAAAIAFILEHAEAKLVLVDREFAATMRDALERLSRRVGVVDIADPEYAGPGAPIGDEDYDAMLAGADPAAAGSGPTDEWDSICLNYTSGTTGNPKGVVYHHRGAYLNAMGNVIASGLRHHAVYLWTLPMFHCNGWCYPWTIALLAGTNVCLRRVEAPAIFAAIREHRVDYFCAAPVVLTMLVNARPEDRFRAGWPVEVLTGGAAPPAATIAAMEELGIDVTHLYGLTETYGPAVVCSWHDEWDTLPLAERARLKSRIGVRMHTVDAVRIVDPETGVAVPADGTTMGEVVIRGNSVMKGYRRNPEATAEAFRDGWFHSGDLGVVHPDGYLQIKDRAKDIVISGGENISTLEVEDTLYQHPAVLEAAVVAKPDVKWGETPCAFVALKEGRSATAEEIIAFCRTRLAGFKVPRTVVFGPLPKTATGKIQKYVLREEARKQG